MHSISREEIQEDFNALRGVVSRVVGHSYDAHQARGLTRTTNRALRRGQTNRYSKTISTCVWSKGRCGRADKPHISALARW